MAGSERAQAFVGGRISSGERSPSGATMPARPSWPFLISCQKLGSALRRFCGTMSMWPRLADPNRQRSSGENCSRANDARCERFAAMNAIRDRSARLNRAIGPQPPLDRRCPERWTPADPSPSQGSPTPAVRR
jgi:hypothetical protein